MRLFHLEAIQLVHISRKLFAGSHGCVCVCVRACVRVCVQTCVDGSDSGVRTKREKRDLDYKKTVLSLAKQHRSASDLEKVDRYYMPADDKVALCSLSCPI